MLNSFMCIVWHSTSLSASYPRSVQVCVYLCTSFSLSAVSLSRSLYVCSCVYFVDVLLVYIIWHQASDIQVLQRVFTRRALRKCVHTQEVYVFSSNSIFTYVSTFYSLHPQKPHTSFRFFIPGFFFLNFLFSK